MSRLTRARVNALLAKQDRFLYLTLGTEPCYQVNGAGVVPRKIAEDMCGLFSTMPTQRKGERPLIPQGDGLFAGFSQTWKMEG